MRTSDGLTILAHEVKNHWKLFLVYLIVTVMFLSISYSLNKTSNQLPEIFKSQIPEEVRNNKELEFIHAHYDDENAITSLGLKNTMLKLDNESELYENTNFFSEQGTPIQPNNIQFVPLTNTSHDVFVASGGEITDGMDWLSSVSNSSKSDSFPVWIRTDYARSATVDIGDELNLLNSNTSYSVQCHIKGIYKDALSEDMETSELPQILLPIELGVILLKDAGISDECSGTATMDDFFDYPFYASKLKEMGILTYGTEADELIKSVTHISYFFTAFIIILNIAGFALLLSFLFMHIAIRTRFIGIIIALGMKHRDILLGTFLIFECILVVSVLISRFVGEALSSAINMEIKTYIAVGEMPSGMENWNYLFVVFIGLNILLAISLLWIRTKIFAISPVKVIMESAS